jgi:dihydrolipoamide dehydrogenase
VTGIHGYGSITGPGQVSVKKEDGSSETLKAKNILLAVGSEVTPFPGIEVCRIHFLRIFIYFMNFRLMKK